MHLFRRYFLLCCKKKRWC